MLFASRAPTRGSAPFNIAVSSFASDAAAWHKLVSVVAMSLSWLLLINLKTCFAPISAACDPLKIALIADDASLSELVSPREASHKASTNDPPSSGTFSCCSESSAGDTCSFCGSFSYGSSLLVLLPPFLAPSSCLCSAISPGYHSPVPGISCEVLAILLIFRGGGLVCSVPEEVVGGSGYALRSYSCFILLSLESLSSLLIRVYSFSMPIIHGLPNSISYPP